MWFLLLHSPLQYAHSEKDLHISHFHVSSDNIMLNITHGTYTIDQDY